MHKSLPAAMILLFVFGGVCGSEEVPPCGVPGVLWRETFDDGARMRHWAGEAEKIVDVQEVVVRDGRGVEHLAIRYAAEGNRNKYDYWHVDGFPPTSLSDGRRIGIRVRIKSDRPVQLKIRYHVEGSGWSGVLQPYTADGKLKVSKGSGQWETMELTDLARKARASVEDVIKEGKRADKVKKGDENRLMVSGVGFNFFAGPGAKVEVFLDDVLMYDQDLYRADEDVEGLAYRLGWVARCTEAPTIDGHLSKNEQWDTAPALRGFWLLAGGPQEVGTEGRLLYDSEALYVGVRCDQTAGKAIKAEAAERDGSVFHEDSVEVFLIPPSSDILETMDERSRYFQLAVNARGTRYDGIAKHDPSQWDAEWSAGASSGDGRWEVEIAVPFPALGASAGPGDVWKFNLCRNRADPAEHSSWSPVRGTFHDVAHFAYIAFAADRAPSRAAVHSIVLRQQLRETLHVCRSEIEEARFETASLSPEDPRPARVLKALGRLPTEEQALEELDKEVGRTPAEELIGAFSDLRERAQLLLLGVQAARFDVRACGFWRDAPQEWPFLVLTGTAITNQRVVPDRALPKSYRVADSLSARACRGEYEPVTFSIVPLEDLEGVEIEIDDLAADRGALLSAAAVDVRVVKCWYQEGRPDTGPARIDRVLVPELLLKDDRLVVADRVAKRNLLRTAAGLVDISDPQADLSDIAPQDAQSLQPFDISARTDVIKQVWLTIHVPDDAEPGTYRGSVHIRPRNTAEVAVPLSVEVLPFTLAPPRLEYSIYYRGLLSLDDTGSIGSEVKSPAQFLAEMKDMVAHGVASPTIYFQKYLQRGQKKHLRLSDDQALTRVLELRERAGMPRGALYLGGYGPDGGEDEAALTYVRKRVKALLEFVRRRGYRDLYFMGWDEAEGDRLARQRPAWQAVHEAGGKIFAACHKGWFAIVGDLLDLPVFRPAPGIARKVHDAGHRVFTYGSPHNDREEPLTYRRNFGLALWKLDYDGAMGYAFQHAVGHIWNDFDSKTAQRDLLFTYPTVDGVIDTVQWEGFREAVDDVRYLSTLLSAIEQAKDDPARRAKARAAQKWVAGMDLAGAERDIYAGTWTAPIEAEDLLDELRRQISDRILDLRH